jgi:uncharacterized membrane protein YhaH (DUF805 family)
MDLKYPLWMQEGESKTAGTIEIVGTSLQCFYTIVFLAPSVALLIKKWHHLDLYSVVMLIIYQVSMILKLVFYFVEIQIPDYPEPGPQLYMKVGARTTLFIINSIFLMSLHIFVQKL